MSAADVARTLGGRRSGHGYVVRCVAHDDHTPSLSLADGEGGRLLVKCWAGCDPRDVLARLRDRGLIGGSGRYAEIGRETRSQHGAARDATQNARALRLWQEARPAAGTIVERYLRSRAITVAPPPCIRFHPCCPHPSGSRLSAMLALVEREGIGPVAIHRTFLLPDGSGKANVSPDKASLGPIRGGAVRLGVPREDQWLAIAEGLETALSVVAACALPTWAALSAIGVKRLLLPTTAQRIVICADNDLNEVGQSAACRAAQGFLAEGRRVKIALPPRGSDFNDLLSGHVHATVREATNAVA